jgi:hypothetical protein
MSRLKIGIASILGLAAALAARPEAAEVENMITAARLSPVQKFVVPAMADLDALEGARPGDYVTVVTGASGEREVREVVAIENGLIIDSVIVERDRDVQAPVTEVVEVGPNGELPLSYAPTHGLDSILNFGNVLFTDQDTGESVIYPVVDGGAGVFEVDPELAGKNVKVQYIRTTVLAAGTATVHQA